MGIGAWVEFAVEAVGVVADFLLEGVIAVAGADFARVGVGEDGFEAAGDVAGEEGDGAGGGDGGEVRVADAVFFDAGADVLRELLDEGAAEIFSRSRRKAPFSLARAMEAR